MRHLFFAFGILFLINGIPCFIIPDEIPSLLSVIYSNIPIIKKGTDSRVGWGFRLGDRADFQFLVELGPQKYTQPLANEPDKTVSNKRNTLNDLASQLWAQRQEDKKRQQEKQESQNNKPNDASSWLKNWSAEVKTRDQPLGLNGAARPGLAIGEIDAKSVIPPDEELQGARENHSRNLKEPVSSTSQKPTTAGDSATTLEESENNIQ